MNGQVLLDDAEEMFERAPCGYLCTDHDERIVRVNATFERWTGLSRRHLVGLSLPDILTPGSRMYLQTHYLPVLQLRDEVTQVALDVLRGDGTVLPMLVNAVVVRDADGAPVRTRITLVDATERRSYERELVRARLAAEAAARHLQVLHSTATSFAAATSRGELAAAVGAALRQLAPAAGVAVWLPDAAGDLRRAYVHGHEHLLPVEVHERDQLPVLQAWRTGTPVVVMAAEDVPADRRRLADAMREHRVMSLAAGPLHFDGQVLGCYQVTYERMRSFPDEELRTHQWLGEHGGLALHRTGLQEQLRHAASHDGLTGAANRAQLEDRLSSELCAATRTRDALAVLTLDLDEFKAVNDSYGHRWGDELLRDVTRRLRAVLPPGALLARVGGDEFTVVAAAAEDEALELARQVVEAAAGPVDLHGRPVSVTCSVGVVVHHGGSGDDDAVVQQLVHLADMAMYEAKASGKNRYRMFDVELQARVTARAAVEAEVRRALAEGDVLAHYQPVLDLGTGRPVGAEALCRIRSGDLTLMPAQFIDIATGAGLIDEIGARMLRLACAQARRWASSGRAELVVAVNVAAEHVASPDYADEVLQILQDTGCRPEQLQLELTESTLLDAAPSVLGGLQRLRRAGVGLALDDFGTRYASLHYVQTFPLTTLKIDRSFVAGIPGRRTEAAIVHAIVTLARGLGVQCIAEGIETPAQREVLAGLGVHGQGFGLARPMPARELAAYLDARHDVRRVTAPAGDGPRTAS